MSKWQMRPLGELCLIERGGSPRPIDKYITEDPNGINWIKIGDTTESMYITRTKEKIIPEGMKKSRYVQKGDFLLSNSMSFGRPYILDIDGCIHDGWLVIRDNDGLFDKRFLYYFLGSPVTYQKFKSMAVGGVVNNLNIDMVKKVHVPVLPITEQVEIADRLDKVTNLINYRKEQVQNLDDLVKSRFIELFGDPERNTHGWDTTTIGKVIKSCEAGWSANGTQREKKPGEIAVLKVSAVTKGVFAPEECKVLDNQGEIKKYVFPQKGDLLFSRANTREMVGATAVIMQDYPELILPDKLWKIRFVSCANVLYMKHVLSHKSIRTKFSAVSTGTSGSMFNVSMENFRSIVIPLPPLELQNEFAAFVEQTDKLKLAVTEGLTELETLKKSLMQQYFG